MPERFLLYIRQSHTPDPTDSLSLDFQERALRDLAQKRGAVVLEPPIIDPDEKGWDPSRPGIEELVTRVERQQPDAVAVYAVSRFARDNWLQEGIWRRLQQSRPGIRFESATEPHAHDDLVRGILGVVSQAERKRMGRFLSSSFQERAHRGLPHGRVPYGYVKGDDGRLVVDEDAADVVRGMIDRIEQGASLWQLARELNATGAGGRSWEPNIVRNTVKSYAAVGAIKCGETIAWDTHEAIVSRDQWERVRAILETRRPTRSKPLSSWLEGLLDCGCGAPVHLVVLNDRGILRGQFRCSASPNLETFQRKRHYPVCTHTPRSMTMRKAERGAVEALTDAFAGMLPADAVYERQRARYEALTATSAKEIAKLERQASRLAQERERLLVVYRRGSLDVERWESEDRALAGRIDLVTRELAIFGDAPARETFTTLAESLDHLRLTLIADPARARQVLLRLGARVRLRSINHCPPSVGIVWPDRIAPFFDAIA